MTFDFSTKTYVVGTQKNRLNEMVLLSTQNIIFKLMGKKLFTFLHSKIVFIKNLCGPHGSKFSP